MAWKRVVVEMGMGTDIRGGDYTKAAVRALRDALWHNSLGVTRALGMDVDSMRVEVVIGVPKPEAVDKAQVLPCCRTEPERCASFREVWWFPRRRVGRGPSSPTPLRSSGSTCHECVRVVCSMIKARSLAMARASELSISLAEAEGSSAPCACGAA